MSSTSTDPTRPIGRLADRALRILLGAALFAYCAAIMFGRWLREKVRRLTGAR